MKDLSFIANLFPAFTSRKAAISLQLVDYLMATIGTGISYEQISTMLEQMHAIRHSRLYDTYMSYELVHKGERYLSSSTLRSIVREWPPQKFSSFNDTKGFSGKAPSPQYLLSMALAHHRFRRPTLVSRLMMVTGRILKGDMSFKLAKKIRCERAGQYECLHADE